MTHRNQAKTELKVCSLQPNCHITGRCSERNAIKVFLTQLWSLWAIIPICQARCIHWCSSHMPDWRVTNIFLIELEFCSMGRNICLELQTNSKNYSWGSHKSKWGTYYWCFKILLLLKYLGSTHKLELFWALAKEASVCSWQQIHSESHNQ